MSVWVDVYMYVCVCCEFQLRDLCLFSIWGIYSSTLGTCNMNCNFVYLLNPSFLLFPSPPKIESSSLPTLRWRTAPSSSVTMPSVRCVVTPEQRWCRSLVPAASCMDPTPRGQQWPRWLKLCWEQRRGRWRFPSTLKTVWSCQLCFS